jgi:hypothetical protein
MTEVKLILDFPGSTESEQDELAKSLAREVASVDGVKAQPRNPDSRSQFGASEVLMLLDSHAIELLALGIQTWLALRHNTYIRVRRGKDEMIMRRTMDKTAIEALKTFMAGK